MRSIVGLWSLLAVGCALHRPVRETPLDVVEVPPPPKPVEIVEVPKLLPLPGQLVPAPVVPSIKRAPEKEVADANHRATVEPDGDGFLNAIQVWPYSKGALYSVYSTPGRVTDIALEAGEQIISASAGDTVRWVIGDTTSGAGTREQVHLLIKPTRLALKTNLVINTDRRTYYLDLASTAVTWMASVSWSYPNDRLALLRTRNAEAEARQPVAAGLDLEHLSFRYEITGDDVPWKPLRAFDDGARVYIEFPRNIDRVELPPLFVIGSAGQAELVNYRVRSRYYIVDRLFDAAELRLGGKGQKRVRITRSHGASAP